jgi:putative transposase
MDSISLLACLGQSLDRTTLRRMSVIVNALLTMTGRVTMLGLSRWSEAGGSYRTVQRWFNTVLPWGHLFWLFFRHHLWQAGQEYLLAGDESVVTKAGKHTYGLDRFFASLYGKPVPGLSFFTLSLVSVQERCSYPLLVEQQVKPPSEARKPSVSPPSPKPPGPRNPGGRPKGSKTQAKTQIEWTPGLRLLAGMLTRLLPLLGGLVSVSYLVLDGQFGNNNVLQLVLQSSPLQLISKLHHNAALWFPYAGPYAGRGPRRRYGDKVGYAQLPGQYCQQSGVEDGVQTDIYQATLWQKAFAQPLNVVILVKTNLTTHQRGQVVLFSSDLTLAYDKLIDYYSLRFQLEFNFRDAKQYWGLEDFMNVNPTPVTNAVNLSLFMVNVSQCLLTELRRHQLDAGVLDLKTHFRGRKYALATLNLLPEPPPPVLLAHILHTITALGCIHRPAAALVHR